MKILPNIKYVYTTNKDYAEIRELLNDLLKSHRYQGYWENDCLLISKITAPRKFITPVIKVQVVTDSNVSKILIESSTNYYVKWLLLVMFIFLFLIETFAVRSVIVDKTLNIGLILPVVFGMFIYTIVYIHTKWDCDNFNYEIRKILK